MDERNDYNSIPLQPTQTAVEWLECELKKIPFINVIEVFEQAKQMEKEQIIDAWIEGGGYSRLSEESDRILAEQYYNQTYENTNGTSIS
tara:strand:+ start:18303 stop:18569 length:267 start_codon:yes stop_codon:yes gene_type:complete